MITIDRLHVCTILTQQVAIETVDVLNKDPKDDWGYKAVPKGKSLTDGFIIEVKDEEGIFVEYL